MAMEKITENGVAIALVTGTCALTDEQTALDLIMEARYTLGAERIAIEKAAVSPDFFILSTGLAGAVLQKFINYGAKLAVYGDYSGYTSKPLRDFIRESNRGRDIFFPATRQEAILRLAGWLPRAARQPRTLSATPCPHRGRSHTAWQSLGLNKFKKVKQNPPRSKRVRRAAACRKSFAFAPSCL